MTRRHFKQHTNLLATIMPLSPFSLFYLLRRLQLLNPKAAQMLMATNMQRDHAWVHLSAKVGSGYMLGNNLLVNTSLASRAM